MASKYIALRISDAVIEGEELWSYCHEFNGLLYADLENGKAQIIDSFPELPLFTYQAFGCIVKLDDILVFVPGMADAVYTYHIKRKEFQVYALPAEMVQMSGKYKFNQAVVYEKNVFMLGYSEPCIVCFNVSEGYMAYYGEWYRAFVQRGFEHEILLFDKEICVLENRIFFPPRNGDCIIEFDMEKRKTFFHNFKCRKDWYYNLYYEDGFFWTYGTKSRSIIRLNDKFEVLEELSIIEMEPQMTASPLVEGDAYFRFSYIKGDYVWLYSDRYAKYVQVDTKKKHACIYDFNDKEAYGCFSHTNIKHIQDKIYILEPSEKRIYTYNDEMEKLKMIQLEMDQRDLFKYFAARMGDQIFYESESCVNLEYLIWHIQNKDYSYDKGTSKKSIGTEIWKG